MPRLRYPLRIAKQVTARNPVVGLVLVRALQTVGRPISRGYSVRGSTATQPSGSPSR